MLWKNNTEAIHFYEQALKVDPKYGCAYENLATLYNQA